VAAKIIHLDVNNGERVKQIRKEINIHQNLGKHPNIVRFLSAFYHEEEGDDYIVILTELCNPITLESELEIRKKLPEKLTIHYLSQISRGLQYLHEHLIIHRDLKPGNIFFKHTLEPVIGDFGLATQLSHPDQRRKKRCGTPAYLAPEMFDLNSYSFPVDIWALGVMTYLLLTGEMPFESKTVMETYRCIEKCEYHPLGPDFSPGIRQVVHDKMLTLHEESRATAIELISLFDGLMML